MTASRSVSAIASPPSETFSTMLTGIGWPVAGPVESTTPAGWSAVVTRSTCATPKRSVTGLADVVGGLAGEVGHGGWPAEGELGRGVAEGELLVRVGLMLDDVPLRAGRRNGVGGHLCGRAPR